MGGGCSVHSSDDDDDVADHRVRHTRSCFSSHEPSRENAVHRLL